MYIPVNQRTMSPETVRPAVARDRPLGAADLNVYFGARKGSRCIDEPGVAQRFGLVRPGVGVGRRGACSRH